VPLDFTIPAPGGFALRSPKHAPTVAPEPAAGDLRSVGELLVDADYHARTLLLDADADAGAAAALLRTWGSTVGAEIGRAHV